MGRQLKIFLAVCRNFVVDHITCNGWTNGSITWNGSGGVGSATTYSYQWSTGDTTYTINNLGIGNYTLTVTDQNNCSSSATSSINGNNILTSSVGNTQNPTCWNYCDGEFIFITEPLWHNNCTIRHL